MKIGTENISNLEFLFNHTKDVIWSIDQNMNLVCSNRAFNEFIVRVTGKKPEVGQSVLFAEFGEETIQYWTSLYVRALAGEQFTIALADERSETPYNEVTLNPITDADGNVVGAGCFSRDVSAYKNNELELQRAHEKLKNSEERYRALIQSSSDVVLTTDENGIRNYISPSIKNMLGYEVDELLGKPVFDLMHPDDIPKVQKEFARALDEPNLQTHMQVRFKHKNGSWRCLGLTGSNQLDNPAVKAMVANIRDVTEQVEAEQKLKESERLYRSLAENFPNGNIGVLDLDLNFKYMAGEDLKLYGIDPKQFIGSHYPSSFEPEQKDFVQNEMAKALKGQRINFQIAFGGFDYIVSAVPLYDDQNQLNEVLVVAQNITQLKKAEDALRESKEKFQMLSEHSPVGIFQVDTTGNCTWMNGRMCEILGIELAEGLDFGYSNYFYPEDREQLLNAWKRLETTNESSHNLTFRILTKDRQMRWAYTQVAPLHNQQGDVAAYVCTVKDISVLKHYQEELIASRAQLEQVLHGMPQGVIFFDNLWRITYVNHSATKILGMPKPDLLGWNVWDRFPESVGTEFQTHYLNAKQQNIHFNYTGYYDPLKKWLEIKGVPNSEGFLVYFSDVSEQMELSHHMERIYEMSPAMLGIVDKDLHFANFNPAMSNILGFSEEELKEKPFYDFVYADDRANAIDSAVGLMKTHGYTRDFENRFQTRNGDFKWISWSVYGQPERNLAYFVAYDVTQKKELEAERKKYQEQLEQIVQKRTAQLVESNDELESFNYTVSHDLRTPIRAIQMFVTLLERECNEKETCKAYTQSIKACTEEMGTLINGLLEFSRLRRQPLNLVEIDMQQKVEETANYLLALETRKDINLKINKLHPAFGDQILIKCIWQNLISNAIKYSKHSHPINITISSILKNGMVEYCVEDNGIGFDMKYANKLFKPFSRLHSGTEYKGTGAGLAIVERIASRHGGTVKVYSELNKGSKFYFSLSTPKKK